MAKKQPSMAARLRSSEKLRKFWEENAGYWKGLYQRETAQLKADLAQAKAQDQKNLMPERIRLAASLGQLMDASSHAIRFIVDP